MIYEDRNKLCLTSGYELYPQASWEDVVQALEKVEEKNLAAKLRADQNVIKSVIPEHGHNEIEEVTVKEDLVGKLDKLHDSFVSLTKDVKGDIENKVNCDKMSIKSLIHHTGEQRAFPIKALESVQTTADFFQAIKPHYNFLNCHLIVSLAILLSGSVAVRANEHNDEVKQFKKDTRVMCLHKTLKFYYRKTKTCFNGIFVQISLEDVWGRHNMWLVEVLIQTLFSLDQHQCQWFEVIPGSLKLIFLIPEYLMMLAIVNSVKKLEFMRLIGIVSLQIGKIYILREKEDKTFSFDKSLIQATEKSNIELVQFLLKFMEIDIDKARETDFITEPIIISNNIFRLYALQLRFAETVRQIENNVRQAVQNGRVTLEELKKFIGEERPSIEFLHPADSVTSFFQVIRHFCNFFNHSLIVSIARFLGPRTSASNLANVYDGEAETFKRVVSVNHLKDSSHHYFQTTQPTGTIRVSVVLANVWQTCSVSMVEKLMQVVFSLMHRDELQWFKVISGSLIIIFLTPKKMKRFLIENSKKKIEFMRLLGITSVKVGGDYVFENSCKDYSLKNGIAEGEELGNNEAVKFLSMVKRDSIATTQQIDYDLNHNLLFRCDADVTALMISCSNSDIQLAKILLDNKADPNIETEGRSTALMYATMVGNVKLVQLLLDHNAEIDKIYNWDQTVLYIACDLGHTKVVEELLARKPNINTREYCGQTPVYIASRNNYLPIVKKLIEAKADPNIPDKAGGTPLSIACDIHGNVQVVKLLLEAGADPNSQDCNGLTSLLLAVSKGNIEIFESLLEANANPDLQDSRGISPLHVSCGKGNFKMIKSLLRAQANPNIQNNEGDTPVHMASKQGHVKALKSLFEAGADPNIPNKNGLTPLHQACVQGAHVQVIITLLNANADPNLRNSNGLTAPMIAILFDHLEILQALLKANVNPNMQTSSGDSLLHMACSRGNLEATKALIKANADANIQDVNGDTPLLEASLKGHVKVLEALIQANADPNIQNDNGVTALHVASQRGYLLVVSRLLDANIDPNVQSIHGITALHLAEMGGHVSIEQLLLKHGANPDIRANFQQLFSDFTKQFQKK